MPVEGAFQRYHTLPVCMPACAGSPGSVWAARVVPAVQSSAPASGSAAPNASLAGAAVGYQLSIKSPVDRPATAIQ